MILKVIACDVFARILYREASFSPHIVALEPVPMLAHNQPKELPETLQQRIDASGSARPYDRIILAYGLCGNAAVGLRASGIPLTIPRVHDCCTLFCGSVSRFLNHFGDALSTRWRSNGYAERCDIAGRAGGDQMQSYKTRPEYLGYLEKYGEENADYIWETLHPPMETDDGVYIRMEGYEYQDTLQRFQKDMEKEKKTVRLVEGSTDYLHALINGPWENDRFLTVPPGGEITGVYDMYEVMRVK